MKTLILMRHGHAYSTIHSGVARDEDRPLSEDGVEGAIRAAAELKRKNLIPAAIVSSPLLRAAQTAREIANTLGGDPDTEIRLNGGFSVAELWNHGLAPRLQDADVLLAIGHQPGIGILAGTLLGKSELPMPAGGFYALRFDAVPKTLEPACATLLFCYV